jgi:hypothetical protein
VTVGQNTGLIGNDGALKARFQPSLTLGWAATEPANQVPVERLLCAYIGQSACQAAAACKTSALA